MSTNNVEDAGFKQWLAKEMDPEDIIFIEKNGMDLDKLISDKLNSFAKISYKAGIVILLSINILIIYFAYFNFSENLIYITAIIFFSDLISLFVLQKQNSRLFLKENLEIKKNKPELIHQYLLFHISKDIQVKRGVWKRRS